MRDFIKLIIKCIIFALLVVIFCTKIVMPQFSLGYCAAFVDKYNLEHKSGVNPRIILLGDSNVAFGFDSELIEEAFDMPVVNMGLHAGLGQAFCMDIAKSGIREGDVVVLSPAGFTYGVTDLDGTMAWTMLENDMSLLREVNPRDYHQLVKGFPAYLKKAIWRWQQRIGEYSVPNAYERDSFNEYGDIKSTGAQNIMVEGYDVTPAYTYVNHELLDYFNKYNEDVSKVGATLLLACAPIIDSPNQSTPELLSATFEDVTQSLDFTLISDWNDYVYPMEYFYDTNFHLNDKGRKFRTEQLIQDISEWMNK